MCKRSKILAVQWESVSLHHLRHEDKVRVMWPAITSSIDLSGASSHIGNKKTFGMNYKKKIKKRRYRWRSENFIPTWSRKATQRPASTSDPPRLQLGGGRESRASEPGARHFPRTLSHWQLRLPSIPRCRPRGAWPRHWILRTSRFPPSHSDLWPHRRMTTKEGQKISCGL